MQEEPDAERDGSERIADTQGDARSHAGRVVSSLLAFAALVAAATGVILLLVRVVTFLHRRF